MDIDPNDPVAMLRIDKKSMMAANKEFETKKWVWVTDEKEGYKAAEIKSTKGDKLMVETNDGKVDAANIFFFFAHSLIFTPTAVLRKISSYSNTAQIV